MKAIIYTKDYCPYCTKAKNLLTIKGVECEEIDVTHDNALAAQMVEKSGGGRTVPQIFLGERYVGGFDDLNALHQSGELDKILKQ